MDGIVTKKRVYSRIGRLIHCILRLRRNVEVEDDKKEHGHSKDIHIKHKLLIQIFHNWFYGIIS